MVINALLLESTRAQRIDAGTVAELVDTAKTASNPRQCAALGAEVLEIVRASLSAATTSEILRYSAKGRGADFTKVNVFCDTGTETSNDDLLCLHSYPRETRDTWYHKHKRRVVSTVASGQIINRTATAELCDPGVSAFDVWDCRIVDDICVPEINPDIGVRLQKKDVTTRKLGSTYSVETDEYHVVQASVGTITLCLFTAEGAVVDAEDGRVLGIPQKTLDAIKPLAPTDIVDLRRALTL